MDQIGEYFESRFQKSVENFGTGLFRIQNFSTKMYMFHFISQDALEVINWVTGCLKEPTGDCDAFFFSWCCRDCGSGHGDYDIDGSNNCNYYFAARAPSIPAMSERKGFFHGRSSLKYRVLAFVLLVFVRLNMGSWPNGNPRVWPTCLLIYGRTDWLGCWRCLRI